MHFLIFSKILKISEKLKKSTENQKQSSLKLSLNCLKKRRIFFCNDTCTKIFSQNLEGRIFKVPYNSHRGGFQKNEISGTVVKARKLIFFVLSLNMIGHAQKVKLSLTSQSRQQMNLYVQCKVYCCLI